MFKLKVSLFRTPGREKQWTYRFHIGRVHISGHEKFILAKKIVLKCHKGNLRHCGRFKVSKCNMTRPIKNRIWGIGKYIYYHIFQNKSCRSNKNDIDCTNERHALSNTKVSRVCFHVFTRLHGQQVKPCYSTIDCNPLIGDDFEYVGRKSASSNQPGLVRFVDLDK